MSLNRNKNSFYRKLRLDKDLMGAIKCFRQIKYHMLQEKEERNRFEIKEKENEE